MKRFLPILILFLLTPLLLVAQPTPLAPASQAEVDAGVSRTKAVTPYTLRNTPGAGTNGNAVTLNGKQEGALDVHSAATVLSTNTNVKFVDFAAVEGTGIIGRADKPFTWTNAINSNSGRVIGIGTGNFRSHSTGSSIFTNASLVGMGPKLTVLDWRNGSATSPNFNGSFTISGVSLYETTNSWIQIAPSSSINSTSYWFNGYSFGPNDNMAIAIPADGSDPDQRHVFRSWDFVSGYDVFAMQTEQGIWTTSTNSGIEIYDSAMLIDKQYSGGVLAADPAGHVFNFDIYPSITMRNVKIKIVNNSLADTTNRLGMWNPSWNSGYNHVQTNSTLYLQDVFIELIGTNIEDPTWMFDAWPTNPGCKIFVSNFQWVSNGVPYSYDSRSGVGVVSNQTVFANMRLGTLSDAYSANVTAQTVTNYSDSVASGMRINAANGSVTNIAAGYYAISVSATLLDQNSNPGSVNSIGVYTNGVLAGTLQWWDVAYQVNAFADNYIGTPGGGYAGYETLSLAPQVFYLPANTRIDLRISSNQSTGTKVQTAVLDVQRR